MKGTLSEDYEINLFGNLTYSKYIPVAKYEKS